MSAQTNKNQTILGLDIGGTKTAVLEGTYEAEILQRHEFPTEAALPFKEKFPALVELMKMIIDNAYRADRLIKAISVSIGGPLRIGEGILIDPPHLPGWHGVHLKEELEREFPDIPVYIEHDGNTGALAEFFFGAGNGKENLQHLIFLTFGTGLGAGFIVNGKILRGATDTAGEVGHWRLADQGPVGFGKSGSWEGFASGKGLRNIAVQMFPERWQMTTPIRTIVEAILADDQDALKVVAEAGRWMGRGIALLIDALNPQMLVLGSLGVALGDRIIRPIREICEQECLPQAFKACQIVPAVLGSTIGDVAALMAAISAEKNRSF